MTKAYSTPGQPAIVPGIPAMTAEQRRRWVKYRETLESLPMGAELCSGAIEAIANGDNAEKFTDDAREDEEDG